MSELGIGIDASDKDALLGKRIDCLDKGFVRLIDVMGDDAAIVQAARVSYGSGTKKFMKIVDSSDIFFAMHIPLLLKWWNLNFM